MLNAYEQWKCDQKNDVPDGVDPNEWAEAIEALVIPENRLDEESLL